MARVEVETRITAPRPAVFDLARSLSVHSRTTQWTQERIIEPTGKDLLELNDLVTFEAVHLGVRRRLTARVVEFERPYGFVDVMVSGAFASLTHRHEFEALDDRQTLMRDVLDFAAPFGPLGKIAEALFLERYMKSFLIRRNHNLKQIAEETKT